MAAGRDDLQYVCGLVLAPDERPFTEHGASSVDLATEESRCICEQ
jgi:hypothetical protein